MKILFVSVILFLVPACASSDERTGARILCASNHTGEGFDACVKNALRF